ncbi:hypothetical protein [Spirosoma sp.]|uniref:hypothetical protein n=1 Tax=Spirosoma sp. TaxID=1899569 RepID=UPI00262C118A|nr:hypothetical protein [Spirosoma sp.]MCX6213904.1 hypothetical protein [Spirosoma sp.]
MKNFISATLSALFLFVSVSTFAIDAPKAPKKAKSTCSQSSCGSSCKTTAAPKAATKSTVAPANKVAKADGDCCPTSPDCVCIPTGSSCVCVPTQKVASVAKAATAPIVALASNGGKAACPNTPGCICE